MLFPSDMIKVSFLLSEDCSEKLHPDSRSLVHLIVAQTWSMLQDCLRTYHKVSYIRCIKSQILNYCRLVLQLSVPNPLKPVTVKCHYNACHYNANASLTRSILGSQTAPTYPHDHPRVAQHMGYRCEIIAVWSATAAMTPLCSHTNGMKQRYPTCWLCQYSRFMIDLRSNTLIIHLRCSENATNRPIWLPDARMLKTISVAIKLT